MAPPLNEFAQFGDHILVRYFGSDGRQQMTLPMRVVEDREDRTVAWLTEGSEITYWTTQDGRDPRSYPLNELFQQTLVAKRRQWIGPGILRVLLPEVPFQIIHFWDDDGSFRGWYVNFEQPFQRAGTSFDAIDWHVDLWLFPDGTHEWKDEDEAEAAVAAGVLHTEELARARMIGRALIKDPGALLQRVGDWRNFVPPAAWTPLELPVTWNQPTTRSLIPNWRR
jgi:predicted RNA-binding protein associated with RNAse of E/G family